MTRSVVDAAALIHLVSADIPVSDSHELLAPALIRSQTLSALHEAVLRGDLDGDVARDRLVRIGRMPVRLLGDLPRVPSQRRVAEQLGWSSTDDAEYIALTQLQAECCVTLDSELAVQAGTLVRVGTIENPVRL
jgi:predicted nucleic acid-binding protein